MESKHQNHYPLCPLQRAWHQAFHTFLSEMEEVRNPQRFGQLLQFVKKIPLVSLLLAPDIFKVYTTSSTSMSGMWCTVYNTTLDITFIFHLPDRITTLVYLNWPSLSFNPCCTNIYFFWPTHDQKYGKQYYNWSVLNVYIHANYLVTMVTCFHSSMGIFFQINRSNAFKK